MKITSESLLKQYFGYDSFRPMQAQIIESVIAKKDTLVLMPTGGGKSICFQIPALLLPGLCIVVSPLISLMKDQVDNLNANGIPAAFLNSSLDFNLQNTVVRRCINHEIKILYISPERIAKEIGFLLKQLTISLFAIDEAHCISNWGHDFRPEYIKLGTLKDNFPDTPIIALTATANSQTQADIIEQLNLRNPAIFITSFDRPNLSLTIRREIKPQKRINEIIIFIRERQQEAGIIYCLSRKSCDSLVQELQSQGISAASYHAGLSTKDRHQVQTDFIQDRISVVCATIAFGMGIDKSNVRYVIHYNLPKSLEGYYQEIGRAGRDGLPSDTIMYFNYADFKLMQSFANDSRQRELNLHNLNYVQRYAQTSQCRRKALLSYFGEILTDACGNCDVCNPEKNIVEDKSFVVASRGHGKYTNHGDYPPEVFEELRKLRRQIADAEELPAYIVFSDATLREMAKRCPKTNEQLLAISGVGVVKLEKYGEQFLAFFQNKNYSIESQQLTESSTNMNKVASSAINYVSTYDETLFLFNSGLSVEQIAIKRNLTIGTIYSHFERLYRNRQIDSLASFIAISDDEIQAVREVLTKLAVNPSLKEIFERFDGKLEYHKIKLILAYLDKQQLIA